MPKLKVPNLAFREIDFVQKLEQAEWVRFEATVKPKRLVLKVTNVSNHLLQGARLNLDGENWSLGDLKPGEEIEVKRYLPPQQKLDSGLYSPEGSKRLIPTNVAHFEASVRDLTPGPTVGNLVEQRSWVDLEVNSQPLGISAKGGR